VIRDLEDIRVYLSSLRRRQNFENFIWPRSQIFSFFAPQAKILRNLEGQEAKFLTFPEPQAKIFKIF